MNNIFQYRPLFSVQVLQEFYLSEEEELFPNGTTKEKLLKNQKEKYNVNIDLLLIPTFDTKKKLKDYRLLFKSSNYGFDLLTQVSEISGGFVPLIALDEPLKLSFAIFQRNPFFFNYTNIRLEKDLENKDSFLFYFSNKVNNSNGLNYLTKPIESFIIGKQYMASELIFATSGTNDYLLEALEENNTTPTFTNASGTEEANPPWRIIHRDTILSDLPQFVSTTDRIVLRPSFFRHNVKSATIESLTIKVKDDSGILQKELKFKTLELGTPLELCDVDLRALPFGLYTLEVEDDGGTNIPDLGLTLYLDDDFSFDRPIGILECFHEPDGSLGDYNWLDISNNNILLSPIFTIGWKNRSTIWRYYFPEDSPPTITNGNPDDVKKFEDSGGTTIDHILISNTPLALTSVGRKVEIDENSEKVILPNPTISSIILENGKVFSEINMGGGLGPP